MDGQGTVWRGLNTPAGPATLAAGALRDGEILARAWGDGAAWALQAAPGLLGAWDDPQGFAPTHPALARLRRTFKHWRLGRSGLVFESLMPAIIEQKVTGTEAFAGYRALVRGFGAPAPGPAAGRLFVPPGPAQVLAIRSWEWLRLGIDPGRAEPLRRAAMVAPALERAATAGSADLDQALRTIRGVGVWTSAETRTRALGDADAVSFGDWHIARNVGFVLTGVAVDDAALTELLEPYRPHRYRVQRLVELGGLRLPRRGPRMAPRRHLPTRQ